MILLTLAQLYAGTGEPVPEKPPVLILRGSGRTAEWWRVWEPAPPKDAPSCRYKLISKNGVDF